MITKKKLSEFDYKSLLDSFIEVKLTNPDNFLKVAETLTRIGIVGRGDGTRKTLYQSCHILHKNNPDRYYILHFKELFKLDGRQSDFSETDLIRRNRIAQMVADWNLVTIIKPLADEDFESDENLHIKILRFDEKENWNLEPKYQIGRKGK